MAACGGWGQTNLEPGRGVPRPYTLPLYLRGKAGSVGLFRGLHARVVPPVSTKSSPGNSNGKQAPSAAAAAQDGRISALGVGAELDNRQLLRWMFRFLRPVKLEAFLACLYLSLFIAMEILVTRYFGVAVDQIKLFHLGEASTESSFWRWFRGLDPHAA